MMEATETAERFVTALDREDFETAAACVAMDCVYRFRGTELVGPTEIIVSYRKSAAWARASFDGMRYESRLAGEEPGRWRVRYTDLTEHRGLTHRHECEQVLWSDAAGLIGRIEHVDLPGEREKLMAFLASVGVEPMG